METIDDGGPAFPFKCQGTTTGPETYYGMSLRDYFAAHAPHPPAGWIGSSDNVNTNLVTMLTRSDDKIYKDIEWRWFFADLMIAARKANP